MTERQALTAARKMFGPTSFLERRPKGHHLGTHLVLHKQGGWCATIKGWGANWADAIDNARLRSLAQ